MNDLEKSTETIDATPAGWRDFFLHTVLKESYELRKALLVTETDYHRIAWYSKSDARSHYVYGVLDDLIRAATAMMRWREFLSWDNDIKEELIPDDGITRLVLEGVLFEQKLWCRKLSEQFVNVLLFKRHNTQDKYRIYLSCESLSKALSTKRDLEEFDSCDNKNLAYQIRAHLDSIAWIASSSTLSESDFFFAEPEVARLLIRGTDLGKRNLFKSHKRKLIEALNDLDNDGDKLLLGPTYATSYGRLSEAIHVGDWVSDPEVSVRDVESEFSRAWMLWIRLVIHLYELLWIEKPDWIKRIERIFKSDWFEGSALYARMVRKDHEPWDLIFTHGDLAEILEVKSSPFWHNSFRVRYLWRPAIPKILEDEVPSRAVQARILRKSTAKEYFDKMVLESPVRFKGLEEFESMVGSLTNDEAYEILKKVFADMDESLSGVGWLIRMYADNSKSG